MSICLGEADTLALIVEKGKNIQLLFVLGAVQICEVKRMANSLRNKIKHFCYKGELSESERDRLLNALDDTELNQQPCEDTLDRIITQIEQVRDKDKLCEYPYNRCIRIIEEYKEK